MGLCVRSRPPVQRAMRLTSENTHTTNGLQNNSYLLLCELCLWAIDPPSLVLQSSRVVNIWRNVVNEH